MSPLLPLWPSFPLERILYEDEDLVVVDKPVDISTHAPDAARSDDAFSRLKLALAERDRLAPGEVYLGIHQRLDRDTSGVLLFTRRKSANPGVAAEFEGRRAKKTYLAGVVGWPAKLDHGVLEHLLLPGEAGKMRVVPAKSQSAGPPAKASPRGRGAIAGKKAGRDARGRDAIAGKKAGRDARGRDARGAPAARELGQRAVTRYRVLARVGDRALLELSPETGRTHQIRVQIAAMGGKIAGDALYGDQPALRLMLHASRLALRHPSTGEPLEVRAVTPVELEEWLAEGPRATVFAGAPFTRRLAGAIEARWALGHSGDTTAFRLVHDEGDGLDGLAVDLYGEHLVAHFFSPEAIAAREAVLDELALLGPRGVYVKVHPKQSNTLVDPRIDGLAPALPPRGEAAADPAVVRESGLAFRVRLGDGLKTGIFLDQRENRRRVRELARGKTVLNLFAYTCAFTVAAAAGGARSTVSVDASKGGLVWGEENLTENGFPLAGHQFVAADVFDWLRLAAKRKERYDVIVLDPPSYATTKSSRFSAEQDLPKVAALALAVLAPGGRMLACTNHRGISRHKFRKQMHEAGRLAGRTVVQVKDLPDPTDFPAPIGADPHLKSVLVTVE